MLFEREGNRRACSDPGLYYCDSVQRARRGTNLIELAAPALLSLLLLLCTHMQREGEGQEAFETGFPREWSESGLQDIFKGKRLPS